MAGEMTQKDLEVGGEWWEAKENMLAVAHSAGLNESYVIPFDQYQGPQCILKKNGVVVGSLWLIMDEAGGYLIMAENGRKKESIAVSGIDQSKDIHDFLKETWLDWNMGYNPEKIEESQIVSNDGDTLTINEDGYTNVFRKCKIGDELTSIVENFNKRMIEYKFKYYVLED
jgi:hypothetical protein